MATYGITDDVRKRIVTVQAKTPKEALEKFKAGGYVGHGWVYTVEPMSEATANQHFKNAADLARKGRE